MKINQIICLIACVGFASLAASCDQNKSGPVATAPDGEETPTAEDQPAMPKGTDLFQTGGPAAAVPTNTPTDVELAITPSAGFKINTRFDWSFEFHPNDAVKVENPTIDGEKLKLDDAKAKIPVKVTATAPGEHTLTATGNFSVCNDDKCELYRDREVTFKMAATDG